MSKQNGETKKSKKEKETKMSYTQYLVCFISDLAQKNEQTKWRNKEIKKRKRKKMIYT